MPKALEILKSKLISTPILSYPSEDPNDLFILDTDASDRAIGCVLSQQQEREERVIAYGSKMLSSSQCSYCVTYRELLAVVEFVRHFRHYLLARRFLLTTDHGSLRWLLNFRDSGDCLIGRWLARLAIYDFQIEHQSEASHSNADALSRIEFKPKRKCERARCEDCAKLVIPPEIASTIEASAEGETTASVSEEVIVTPGSREEQSHWLPTWTKAELREMQEKDPELGQVISWLKEHHKPGRTELLQYSQEVRAYCSKWNELVFKDGVLYASKTSGGGTTLRFVAIPSIRRQLFH